MNKAATFGAEERENNVFEHHEKPALVGGGVEEGGGVGRVGGRGAQGEGTMC